MFINKLHHLSYLYPYIAIIGGLIIGSFLNVVIWRYPQILQLQWAVYYNSSNTQQTLTLATPRSHCPHCNKTIRWYDNIPLISWLLLKGACRNCSQPISYRYPLIEVITALLFLSAILVWPDNYWSLAVIYLSCLLIIASAIDFDYKILPDVFTQNILWSGIICVWVDISPVPLSSSINGVIVGFSSFYIIRLITSILMRKETLGMGDVILFSGLGAWVGVFALPYLALIASVIGIIYIIITKNVSQRIAFGPCLAIAGLVIVYYQAFISF